MKYILLIALVALLLARRIQRSIGFQKYREPALIIRMVVFSIVAVLFLSGAVINTTALVPDIIGIVAGLVLAYIATNHAMFEKRDKGLYFKTHIWVEIVVITLFLLRFAYRIYTFRDLFQPDVTQQEMQDRIQSIQDSFTGGIILVFCSYYLGYFSFILKEAKKALKDTNTPNT